MRVKWNTAQQHLWLSENPIPVTVKKKKRREKVDLISYYCTRSMPIATCHGQFHSQDLWLKHNMVLIVHDAEHSMLNATLLQIATTWQGKKDGHKAKPHALNTAYFHCQPWKEDCIIKAQNRRTEIWDCPIAPAQQAESLQISRKKGMEQTELVGWQDPRLAPAEVDLTWMKWWRNRFCSSPIMAVCFTPSLNACIQFIST